MKKLIIVIISALIALFLIALPAINAVEPAEAEAAEAAAAEPEPEPPEKAPVQLLITCVGDVMVHQSQLTAQHDSSAGTYDFSNNFVHVKKYIEDSDVAIFNLETTFGGPPYTGYPVFSAPDELAKALRQTGFNVAVTANNHMLDRGLSGLERTISVLRENGFPVAGSRASGDSGPRYAMTEVKGVRIAVVAHTYAYGSSPGGLLLNGASVPKGAGDLIDYFRYEQMDEDLEKIKGIVDEAKSAGADIVIAYYHWGQEYQLKSNDMQRRIAERTALDMDVDVIFASHPHTPQEMGVITSEASGKRVPVFYSLGNFISNQRTETLDVPVSRYTEIGIIARVSMEYDADRKEVTAVNPGAVPVWVDKYKSGGRDVYVLIPLDDGLEENVTLAASGHLARAMKAWEDVNGILGVD